MPTKYQGTLKEKRALNAYIKLQRAAETTLANTTAQLSDYGLSTSQFAVLEALYHLGVLSQRALSEKLLKSTGNISIVLKKMEKRNLIERHRDPADNRYMQVRISATGRELIDGMIDSHVAGIVAEMSILTPDEQEALSKLCRKLGLREV